jgi:hypothetical protein
MSEVACDVGSGCRVAGASRAILAAILAAEIISATPSTAAHEHSLHPSQYPKAYAAPNFFKDAALSVETAESVPPRSRHHRPAKVEEAEEVSIEESRTPQPQSRYARLDSRILQSVRVQAFDASS